MRPAYFLLVVSLSLAEKLPEQRRSCANGYVFIESSNFKWHKKINLHFSKNSVWNNAVDYECERDGRKFEKDGRVRRMLPDRIFYRGFPSDESQNTTLPKDETIARSSIRRLLRDNIADKYIRSLINPIVDKMLSEGVIRNTEPVVRLGESVKEAKCFKGPYTTQIRMEVKLMEPEVLKIWKCEDIGRRNNETYEFYMTTPAWMTDGENGKTYLVDLDRCLPTRENKFFCRDKVFYSAYCSVNNLEFCKKKVLVPDRNHHSFSRSLPDGVAVFGAFKKSTYFKSNKTTGHHHISPGLFYFSFSSSNTTGNNETLNFY